MRPSVDSIYGPTLAWKRARVSLSDNKITGALTLSTDLSILAGLTFEAESAALSLTTSKANIPYVNLCGSSSNKSEAKGGPIHTGNYAVIYSKDNMEDIGKGFDFIPIVARPKAFAWRVGLVSFHKDSPLFVQIQKMSPEGTMIGPEFLIWMPQHGIFAAYHFSLSGKTAERASAEVSTLMLKFRKGECNGATVESKIMENRKGEKWHGPAFTTCSSILAMPDPAELQAVVKAFMEAQDSVEIVPDAGNGRER